ncbi:MAG: GNAT family N-acetyltransferase [Terracoccus sp.]
MSAEKDVPDVVNAPDLGRYELRDGGRMIGQAQYVVVPVVGGTDRVVFFHTEVDDAYGGRGLAQVLARFALDDTIAAGRTIVAVCPYIARFVERHPGPYAAHVSRATRADLAALRH